MKLFKRKTIIRIKVEDFYLIKKKKEGEKENTFFFFVCVLRKNI